MNAEINSRHRHNLHLGKLPWIFFFFFTFKPDLAVGMWQGKFSTIQTPCFGEVAASFLDDEIYLFYAFNLFILLPKINCHLTGH